MSKKKFKVVIVGGGAAGISTASRLSTVLKEGSVAIIEPSTVHYYQPLWTLVGGGVFPKEHSVQETSSQIPPGCEWIKDSVVTFKPEENNIITQNGTVIDYEHLVVTAGLEINWGDIQGLEENVGTKGICSNYSYQTVDSTWSNIQNLKKGRAIFTQPSTPIKCGGAPQKIMYLAEDYFKRNGVKNNIDVEFYTGTPGIFSVKKYAEKLNQICDNRGIKRHFQHDLLKIDADNKKATFKQLQTEEEITINYDMIHVTPKMSAPQFIKKSPLVNEGGWVDVNQQTMQHNKYNNIFSCGDCSSLPTSKTAAAIRRQVPIMVANLRAAMNMITPSQHYNGYTSCPLVTGYGRLILAEFDYDLNPLETFPFDQGKERRSMYILKKTILPKLYWKGMLRGRF